MDGFIDTASTTLFDLITVYGVRVLGAIAMLVAGWLIAAQVRRMVHRALVRAESVDDNLARICARLARAGVLIITLTAVLNTFGVQTTSIIALLGGAVIAIGLALQGTLSNVASGVVLLVLQPLRVGEAVTAGGVTGTVDEIGLFAVTLTTYDGECVVVPNSSVWGTEIYNYSRSGQRRLSLALGIGYSDDMDAALNVVRTVVAEHPGVLETPAPIIGIDAHGDSAVGITVRPWVRPDDFLTVKLDLMKAFKEGFDKAGISIPFPQRDLHLISDEVGIAARAA